jgi:hypothetical protein
LFSARQLDRPPSVANLERPEDAKVHDRAVLALGGNREPPAVSTPGRAIAQTAVGHEKP